MKVVVGISRDSESGNGCNSDTGSSSSHKVIGERVEGSSSGEVVEYSNNGKGEVYGCGNIGGFHFVLKGGSIFYRSYTGWYTNL